VKKKDYKLLQWRKIMNKPTKKMLQTTMKKEIRFLMKSPEYEKINSVLGYVFYTSKNGNSCFRQVSVSQSIKHVRCNTKEFLENIKEHKKREDFRKCCDSFNRLFGFVSNKTWFYIPFTQVILFNRHITQG
jgi:phage pi2 protein 07